MKLAELSEAQLVSHFRESFPRRDLGTVVTNADHRALAARERLAEMRHQLRLGELS